MKISKQFNHWLYEISIKPDFKQYINLFKYLIN